NTYQHSTPNKFIGSWYNCDYVGQYSEIHISQDELIHNWAFPNGWYSPHTYKIMDDMLVYYDTLHNLHDKYGNPRVHKVQAVLNQGQMDLYMGTVDSIKYIWTFHKMPFEPAEYEKNDTISYDDWLNKKFYGRSDHFNCQDQR